MKANLPQAEPKMLARWEEMDLYQPDPGGARRAARCTCCTTGRPTPTATSTWARPSTRSSRTSSSSRSSMAGFDAPYVPGWDCHGLPIEIKVDAELGSRKAQDDGLARSAPSAASTPQKYVELHRREFKRLGVFGEWENPYLTMSADYEAVIARAFVDFLDKGYVYKGLKPVHWCMRCRTALAEAEVEYENHASPSIWVRFALDLGRGEDRPRPGRAAACGDSSGPPRPGPSRPTWRSPSTPSSSTWRWRSAGDVYIVARDLLKATAEKCGWPDPKVRGELPRRRAGRRRLPAPVPGARLGRHSGGARDPGSGHRRGAHRARATARRTTSSASSTGSPPTVRWMPPAVSTTPKARRAGCRRRSSARRCGTRTPSSWTSCGSAARCWPRAGWITAIRTAGAATSPPSSAPPSSGSSAWRRTICAARRWRPSRR